MKQIWNTEHNDLKVLISYFSLIFGLSVLQRLQNGEIIYATEKFLAFINSLFKNPRANEWNESK